MSLRDWFAGQLVAGLAAIPSKARDGYIKQRAELAYRFADAMLKARNSPKP